MRGKGSEVQSWDVEDSFAREAAAKRRVYVTRYIGISDKLYVLLGGDRDYLLVEGLYCSCPLFQWNLSKGKAYCHHLAGLREAVARGMVVRVALDRNRVREVALELLTVGFSVELRRTLASSGSG